MRFSASLLSILAPTLALFSTAQAATKHASTAFTEANLTLEPFAKLGEHLLVPSADTGRIEAVDLTSPGTPKSVKLTGKPIIQSLELSPDRSTAVISLSEVECTLEGMLKMHEKMHSAGHGGHGGHGNAHGSSGGHGSHGMGQGGHGMQPMLGALLLVDAKTGRKIHGKDLPAMTHRALFAPGKEEIWAPTMAGSGEVLILNSNDLSTLATLRLPAMPSEMGLSHDGRHAYVLSAMAGSITLIDVATRKIVEHVVTVGQPTSAYALANGMMVISDPKEKGLIVSRTEKPTDLQDVSLGFAPAGVALASNGELVVADKEGGRLVFLDGKTFRKSAEVATGGQPHEIASDGASMYVTDPATRGLVFVDAATRKVTKRVALTSKPLDSVLGR